MTIRINNRLKLIDIQKGFSKQYPYLKLEFFSKPYKEGELTPGKYQIDNETHISDIALKKLSQHITFLPDETVSETERKLREDLGLFAQVFRKSGHVWVQTTSTSHWTLQHQNEHAMEGAKYRPQINLIEANNEKAGDRDE